MIVEIKPRLDRFITCAIVVDIVREIVNVHCVNFKTTFRLLETGFAFAGAGLAFASLIVCACWGRIVKSPMKVAPGPLETDAHLYSMAAKERISTAANAGTYVQLPVMQPPPDVSAPRGVLEATERAPSMERYPAPPQGAAGDGYGLPLMAEAAHAEPSYAIDVGAPVPDSTLEAQGEEASSTEAPSDEADTEEQNQ